MANRYWVGGGGTWDNTNTTNWSDVSGGAGGQSAPTTSDAVFFDSNSGIDPVYCNDAVCASLTTTGYTGGLAGSSITVYGNVVNGAGTLWGVNLTLAGTGSHTLTTNANSFYFVYINSVGGTYTLADAFYGYSIYVQSGTFNTANYNVTFTTGTAYLNATETAPCNIYLGSSTVSGSNSVTVTFSAGANLVFSGGTSNITSNRVTINTTNSAGIARTFYNVACTSTSTFDSLTLRGINTFNNATTNANLIVSGAPTISGALILTAGTLAARLYMTGVSGVQTTLTVNSLPVAPVYWDFSDINFAGAASPLSGAYLGDRGNNNGITFSAPRTLYWVGGTASWNSTTSWATSSGGAPSAANIPLAQDSVVVDNNSGGAGMSIGANAGAYITSLDTSTRTTAVTISLGPNLYLLGNLSLSTACNIFGASGGGYSISFNGRVPQTITSNGATINAGVVISSVNSSVTLADACNISTASGYSFALGSLILFNGTFNTNNYNLTIATTNSAVVSLYVAASTPPLTFALGTSTVSMNRGFTNFRRSVVFTGLSTGKLQFTSSNAKTLAAGSNGTVLPTVEQAGSGTLTITGSARFYNLTNAYKSTGATTVRFAGGTVSTFDSFSLAGEAGRVCTLTSSTAPTRASLTLASGASINAGATSTDAGNNTGVLFTGAGNGYLSVSYINSIPGQSGFFFM